MGYTAAAVAAVDGGAVRRLEASGTPRSKSRRLTAPNAKSVKIWSGPYFGAAVSARLQNSQNSQKPPAGGVPGR